MTFFPDKVVSVLNMLPFSAMQSTPLLIYSGNLEGKDAVMGILFQALWLIALVVLGKTVMSISLKRVVVQGG